MVRGAVGRTSNAGRRTKVKTGCATCKTRKVKCDEQKPFCQKCIKTGRTCDGYESPFRLLVGRPIHARGIKSDLVIPPFGLDSSKFTLPDIDLLDRYFSIKTVFNVKLGCGDEARQVLQASLTDPPVRHAILSLKALREDFEASRQTSRSVAQQSLSYDYGLQQYCMALKSLASSLSSRGSHEARGNYAAMTQHIIRGLRIMREYRARPRIVDGNTLISANSDQLPRMDAFVIKLFAAPCKFTEPRTITEPSGLASSHRQTVESRHLRTIAPDVRAELKKIAPPTLNFLIKVAEVKSVEGALRLLSEKAVLLDSLEEWLTNLEAAQDEMNTPNPEPLSISFMRLFHAILRIILLEALDSSPMLHAELLAEHDRLLCIADSVGERVRASRS